MNRIRCLLVDDEPLAISLLKNHLDQLDFLEIAGTCPNAVKALEILNNQKIDLLFLDIRMPKINGLDLLKTLRNPPRTILTTAYREYALEGYDLDIVDYLLKPITFDRFFKAIERYLRTVQGGNAAAPQAIAEERTIRIKSGYKHFNLRLDDILFIESLKDYVKIHTTQRPILSKYKISDMEKDLEGRGFLRIHRSYIINCRNITSFTSASIEIGPQEIPVGESYREQVMKTLNTRPL